MKKKVLFTILCLICAAVPLAAQTAAPENMVQIPAGKFWMGRAYTIYTDSADLVPIDKLDDRPANNIDVDAFYIDKYEVTNTDYAKFLQATGGKPPWHWPQGKIEAGKEKLPVYNVNWFDATAYCKWAGKRLPTEAEWKKRREADSTGIVTRGETPTSISLKSISRRHKATEPSRGSPYRRAFQVPTRCLSDPSSPTVMVSTI